MFTEVTTLPVVLAEVLSPSAILYVETELTTLPPVPNSLALPPATSACAVRYALDVLDSVMCDVATNAHESLCARLCLAVATSSLI